LLERIERAVMGLISPSLAYELIGREALQPFQTPAKIVGGDRVGKVTFELSVVVIVVAANGGILDRAVHSFDLPIRPRMRRLGQPVLDIEIGAGRLTGIAPPEVIGSVITNAIQRNVIGFDAIDVAPVA
jgi:hypothetical protein